LYLRGEILLFIEILVFLKYNTLHLHVSIRQINKPICKAIDKTTNMPSHIITAIRTIRTRETLQCKIPVHFNDKLANTGQQLETFSPDNKILDFMGVTRKRFFQLMKGESTWLFCEAVAYAKWFEVPLTELYEFIDVKKPVPRKTKAHA
jgi:hypothetical protein